MSIAEMKPRHRADMLNGYTDPSDRVIGQQSIRDFNKLTLNVRRRLKCNRYLDFLRKLVDRYLTLFN